jgi:bifunctional ADP-heptose synthase (sugar kinase/adenylyltransferase)
MPTYPPETSQYLAEFRSRYTARDVIDVIDDLRSLRVVVVGEAILDEYVFTDPLGRSAKEPVLAIKFKSSELFAGGSLAVANHLANFCDTVELVTYLGAEQDREEFVRKALHPNVRLNAIYKANSPTIVKRRYLESYLLSKVLEIYFINDDHLNEDEDRDLCSLLEARVPDSDLVLVADYGHGLMTPNAISLLGAGETFLAVNTQMNAANIGFHAISNYPRADFICLHENEIRLDARSRRGDLATVVESLASRLRCKGILVTLGKRGVSYFYAGKRFDSPAFATEVVDRIGAGDAVLSIASLCAARGIPADMLPFIANLAGAQKVRILGNRSSLESATMLKFIESLMSPQLLEGGTSTTS